MCLTVSLVHVIFKIIHKALDGAFRLLVVLDKIEVFIRVVVQFQIFTYLHNLVQAMQSQTKVFFESWFSQVRYVVPFRKNVSSLSKFWDSKNKEQLRVARGSVSLEIVYTPDVVNVNSNVF